jgi:exonuclease VII large subunit
LDKGCQCKTQGNCARFKVPLNKKNPSYVNELAATHQNYINAILSSNDQKIERYADLYNRKNIDKKVRHIRPQLEKKLPKKARRNLAKKKRKFAHLSRPRSDIEAFDVKRRVGRIDQADKVKQALGKARLQFLKSNKDYYEALFERTKLHKIARNIGRTNLYLLSNKNASNSFFMTPILLDEGVEIELPIHTDDRSLFDILSARYMKSFVGEVSE